MLSFSLKLFIDIFDILKIYLFSISYSKPFKLNSILYELALFSLNKEEKLSYISYISNNIWIFAFK